jgi:hypothetical protein
MKKKKCKDEPVKKGTIEEKEINQINEECIACSVEESKMKDIKVTPYREIVFSDGHEFLIKTTCNLTSDDRVQVLQYREHTDPEGSKFLCTDPTYFEDKNAFIDWLLEMLKKNFEDIPYITISPLKGDEIKKHERETIDTMYL